MPARQNRLENKKGGLKEGKYASKRIYRIENEKGGFQEKNHARGREKID